MAKASREQLRFGLALQLSFIAGFVDAVGYLVLYQVYVANMSGNTVALGVEPTVNKWNLFFRRGAAIPLFVLGMFLSKLAVHWAERRNFRFLAASIYGVEAFLFGVFVLVGMNTIVAGSVNAPPVKYYFLLGLLSLAMGLQNALQTRFGPFSLHTTHITGTLAKFTDELSQFFFWLRERLRVGSKKRLRRILAVSCRQDTFRNAAVLGGTWLCYAVGAFLGALLEGKWQLFSLLIPMSLLIFLAAAQLRNPMALSARGDS